MFNPLSISLYLQNAPIEYLYLQVRRIAAYRMFHGILVPLASWKAEQMTLEHQKTDGSAPRHHK